MQYRQLQTFLSACQYHNCNRKPQDDHLQWLKGYIIIGWLENRDQILWDMRMYWAFSDDMVVIDRIIMKGQMCCDTRSLENTGTRSAPYQPHGNRKTKLLTHKLVCWVNINDDIERHIKNCAACFMFQQIQSKDTLWHPCQSYGR